MEVINIYFTELMLTTNGSLILIGQLKQLEQFRLNVYKNVPIPISLHKNITHITMGRLIQDIDNEHMKLLAQYLNVYGGVKLPQLTVRLPNFVASKGSFSSEMIPELTTFFNYVWRED